MPLVSKRTRYALHGMAFIAAHAGDGNMSLDAILAYLRDYSQRLTLSPGYIAKIFQRVSRSGLAEAVSGPRGGYRLARPAENIRLIEIIEALEGPVLTGCCLLSVGECQQQSTCGVGGVIHEAELAFYRFFETETVASLARRMSFPDLESLGIEVLATGMTTAGNRPRLPTPRRTPRCRTSRAGVNPKKQRR